MSVVSSLYSVVLVPMLRCFFSSVFEITERRDMGMHGVPLSMAVLGLGMGTMLINFHTWGIMLVLRVVIFTLFYGILELSCGECNVISLYCICCSVNDSVSLMCL